MLLAAWTLVAATALATSELDVQPGSETREKPVPVVYALPPFAGPCLGQPCGGVLLADLMVELGEPGGPRAAETRLLFTDRLYLGVAADEARRRLQWTTTRWDLALEHRDESVGLAAAYRGDGFRLSARAADHEESGGDGRAFELQAALRLSPQLELLLSAAEDDRRSFGSAASRVGSSTSLGALWQPSQKVEVGGRVFTGELDTLAGFELDRQGAAAESVFQATHWRLEAALSVEELSGRFDRREAEGGFRLTYRLLPRLVAAAGTREKQDLALGSVAGESEIGLTYYARHFHFPRGGEAARLTAELARRARELGLEERQEHDLEGRRRLRERLALARPATADLLATLVSDLHRAQVAERNVPLAGFLWRRERDEVVGEELRQLEVFLAVPWARHDGPHPLRPDEDAADFLRIGYARVERDISRGFTTEGSRLALDLTLQRELTLRFAWEQKAATGLEFALRTQQPRAFTARLAYRQGI